MGLTIKDNPKTVGDDGIWPDLPDNPFNPPPVPKINPILSPEELGYPRNTPPRQPSPGDDDYDPIDPDDKPLPRERDPGPIPDDPPIVFPPLPPSGPVGPG